MPRRPKSPCRYPGCPNLTDKRYCPEHEKKMNRDYERYSRDPETKKRYGQSWQKIRTRYVEMHPFCEICYENGRIVPVDEVHHKVPLSEGGSNDFGNLISLCKSCHSSLHASRGDRWHKAINTTRVY